MENEILDWILQNIYVTQNALLELLFCLILNFFVNSSLFIKNRSKDGLFPRVGFEVKLLYDRQILRNPVGNNLQVNQNTQASYTICLFRNDITKIDSRNNKTMTCGRSKPEFTNNIELSKALPIHPDPT